MCCASRRWPNGRPSTTPSSRPSRASIPCVRATWSRPCAWCTQSRPDPSPNRGRPKPPLQILPHSRAQPRLRLRRALSRREHGCATARIWCRRGMPRLVGRLVDSGGGPDRLPLRPGRQQLLPAALRRWPPRRCGRPAQRCPGGRSPRRAARPGALGGPRGPRAARRGGGAAAGWCGGLGLLADAACASPQDGANAPTRRPTQEAIGGRCQRRGIRRHLPCSPSAAAQPALRRRSA